MKINESKMKASPKGTAFFSCDGVKIDPDKTVAICNMSRPENQADVPRILGLTTYFSKFLRKVSDSLRKKIM
jgi:hypothetical protein